MLYISYPDSSYLIASFVHPILKLVWNLSITVVLLPYSVFCLKQGLFILLRVKKLSRANRPLSRFLPPALRNLEMLSYLNVCCAIGAIHRLLPGISLCSTSWRDVPEDCFQLAVTFSLLNFFFCVCEDLHIFLIAHFSNCRHIFLRGFLRSLWYTNVVAGLDSRLNFSIFSVVAKIKLESKDVT